MWLFELIVSVERRDGRFSAGGLVDEWTLRNAFGVRRSCEVLQAAVRTLLDLRQHCILEMREQRRGG